MLRVVYHIARNTFRENLREPIYLLVLLTALSLIGILPAFTLFVFREQVKLVVDSALATMLFFGWILAVLSASHAISEEIDSGTANLLLAKPVLRPAFILGKTAGILLGLAVFGLLTGLATLIAVRVAKDQFYFDQKGFTIYFAALALSLLAAALNNFLRRGSFPMVAVLSLLAGVPLAAVIVRWLPVDQQFVSYQWSLLPALVLILYAVWTMGVLATALSTRLALMPNMLVCAFVFVVGLMSDYLLGRYAAENWLAAIFYALVPNWQLFWMADALAAGKAIPWEYVGWGALYVLLFSGFFLTAAILMFQHREVGRQAVV